MNSYPSPIARGCKHQLWLALFYIALGIPVIPVSPRTKRPLVVHGYLDATTDRAQIIAWWNCWQHALVAIPTGARTGLFALDLDGAAGQEWLCAFLARLGLQRPADLTGYIVETPRRGLHLYFRLRPGEAPRTRAGDIAADVDTRGMGGYIIAAGNRLPDGREYRLAGPAHDLAAVRHAPRELLYLAAFNVRERTEIAGNARLAAAIDAAGPPEWPSIIEMFRRAKVDRMAARSAPASFDAMRQQALNDLQQAAADYSGLPDGRRNGLFSVACRLVKYVVNDVLTDAELRSALRAAAAANGAIGAHGQVWFEGVIRRALAYGARDALPPVARRCRQVV